VKQRLLIDEIVGECRTALIEEDQIVEISIDRADHHSKVGNIYVGRVDTVVKALEAAFIELPHGPPGFLSVHEAGALRAGSAANASRIETIAREGQWVVVEVMRDAIGDKGPRLTTQIALPGQLLAYRPFKTGITVSSRIDDKHLRERIRKTAATATHHIETGGFIVRTLAGAADEQQLRQEADALVAEWAKLEKRARDRTKPISLRQEIGPVERALRDWASLDVDRIVVDGRPLFNRARKYLQAHLPSLADRIEAYSGPGTLFEELSVETAIDQALDSRINLPKSGWIMIEHTEALTAIDINSGDNIGEANREQTALSTNLGAIPALARQLRLRDIGGMILIDFIHMDDRSNRRKVLSALQDVLKRDRAPSQLLGWSRMGLVELTRKRSRKPLDDFLAAPANPYGSRRVKNVESVGYDIMRHAKHVLKSAPTGDIVIAAGSVVTNWLSNGPLDTLSESLGRRIMTEERDVEAPDKFDVYVRQK